MVSEFGILAIASGVFFGLTSFAWLMWCLKQLNSKDPEDYKPIISLQFVFIMGFHLVVLLLARANGLEVVPPN
jgi:hypothetical protein